MSNAMMPMRVVAHRPDTSRDNLLVKVSSGHIECHV